MALVTKRLAGNLVLAVASAVGFVALLEMGARGLDLRTPMALRPTEFNCLQRSSLLDVEFRPNCTGTTFETPIHTNALGLRGPQVRDDDSTRILAMGDSCTWGWRVAQGESYPAQLQLALDREGRRGAYQVLNAGIPGASSYHGLVYLRERGLALRPSILIAGYGFNDMTRDGDVKLQFAAAHAAQQVVQLDDGLMQRSTLYRWVRYWADARAKRTGLPPRVPPHRYERNLRQLVRTANRHGARVVLIDLTHFVTEQAYPEALARVARDTGAPLVVYDGPKLDLVHPTVEGYELLVTKLMDAMRAAGYLR